jgi:formate dehydrogenase assembly factor FdhD
MSTPTNLEAFAIEFQKQVDIQEQVDVQKQFDVQVEVQGNSALADVKAEATALGPNSHTETLGVTSTTAVAGVGSSSSSIAESLSLAQKDAAASMLIG